MNFSLISCPTMAKRIQNQKGRRESCVQVATSSDEYFFFYCDKFLHRIESDRIWKSVDADSFGKPDSRVSINPSSSDGAPTSQVRLKRMHTLAGWWKSSGETRRFKKKKIQKTQTILRLEPGTTKRNLLPKIIKLGRNPLHTEPVSSVDQASQKSTEATWDHHLHMSSNTSHFMEAVFSMVRKIHGKPPDDPMEDLNLNLAIWRCSSLSRKRFWHEFTSHEEPSLGLSGTIILWNKKTDLWTVRYLWSKKTRDRWFEK